MYLVINKCVTAVKVSNFSGHYLRNHSTLDIGVLGYIGIVQHKEHSPEVLSIRPGTSCMYSIYIYLFIYQISPIRFGTFCTFSGSTSYHLHKTVCFSYVRLLHWLYYRV